jgi:hypothetical protein
MGALRCVDGSILTVDAVACRDRLGDPYEITLTLARNQVPFGSVGERCGSRLTSLAALVSAARADPAQAAAWPDPDDRFPEPGGAPDAEPGGDGDGGRGGRPASARAAGYSPQACLTGDREYFSLRARERTDLPGDGELRCCLRASAEWQGAGRSAREGAGSPAGLAGSSAGQAAGSAARAAHSAEPAGWRLSRRAVLEAWGPGGIGMRAVLTSAELVRFLDTVLDEPGVTLAAPAPGNASTAGKQLDASRRPARRQRGRVPDGTARTRLPALRAPA